MLHFWKLVSGRRAEVSTSLVHGERANPLAGFVELFRNDDLNKLDKQYFEHFPEKYPKNHYDYLVVGGGSAGAVVAWRLLREGANRVGVIEAGHKLPKIWSRIPAGLGYAMNNPKYTKMYQTQPQKELNNRTILWPRGIGMGGSSNINGMVFVRGHPEDYDNWEKLGAKGWSFKDCLPYFKMSETVPHGSKTFRGDHGPMKLSRRMDGFTSNLTDSFLKAGAEAGYKFSDDFNGPQREGFGYYDLSIHNGNRLSVSEAYCPNPYVFEFQTKIKIHSKKKADEILFDNDKAIGIRCGSTNYYARKEVIVCAGALESPILLMKSGIGDEKELKSEKIPVRVNLPGVGKNLQDHLEVYLQAKTNNRTLYEFYKSFTQELIAGYYWYVHGEGPLNTGYLDSGAFLRSVPSLTNPDIQLHFFPCLVLNHGKVVPNYNAFQIHAGTMRPASSGSLSLKDGKVVIEPNYLNEKSDMENMIKCVEIAANVMNQPSLKNITTKMISDISDPKEFVRRTAETAYHPCGTCKMGNVETDPSAVLDERMRVKGVRNLRVVDASAIPSMVSANLNATVVMMAEKASELILEDNLAVEMNAQADPTNVARVMH